MSRRFALVSFGLLTTFNIIALLISTSPPSRAEVAGMTYEQLVKDQDFSRAVKSLVESCEVNVDLGKLKC